MAKLFASCATADVASISAAANATHDAPTELAHLRGTGSASVIMEAFGSTRPSLPLAPAARSRNVVVEIDDHPHRLVQAECWVVYPLGDSLFWWNVIQASKHWELCDRPLRSDRLRMACDRAAFTEQAARRSASGRPACAEGHSVGASLRGPLAGPSGALWAVHDLLQSLAQERRLGPADGWDRSSLCRQHPDDRQFQRPGPSTCGGLKRGVRIVAWVALGAG